MAANEERPPYEYLVQLERKCRVASPGLPVADPDHEQWSGVLFNLGEHEMVAQMSEIAEIGDMLPMARLPGAKPWVMGLANMRGNLLPVIDLKRFLFADDAPATDAGRLLVVRHGGGLIGLRVDGVVGMRHFAEAQRTGDTPHLPQPLEACVVEGFVDQGVVRPVFSIRRLVSDPAFQDAAV
ncbi:hypothetical protein BJI67_14405 [Acidihalobacter aeolianus]|uniref:CheW-like domain-containing protein n=1 Tax=Acidihalobacter aeolianus TaxID=2792603 RepID=A0A1D8KAX1_9GAMM|nr:chemotaxis protein CheW [Acidihalobacter aeolianus]AOV18095.1 hypothetical protein BJI67_14405 [Acidihalobacter aeolianus]